MRKLICLSSTIGFASLILLRYQPQRLNLKNHFTCEFKLRLFCSLELWKDGWQQFKFYAEPKFKIIGCRWECSWNNNSQPSNAAVECSFITTVLTINILVYIQPNKRKLTVRSPTRSKQTMLFLFFRIWFCKIIENINRSFSEHSLRLLLLNRINSI